MGLRQLYFLLGDLVDKLVYLKYGIAVILAFIGVKLFLHALHGNEVPFINGGKAGGPEISTVVSLVSSSRRWLSHVASLISIKRDPDASFADLKRHEDDAGPRREWLLRRGQAIAYDRSVLSGMFGRMRRSAVWRRRATEHHVLGFGRTEPRRRWCGCRGTPRSCCAPTPGCRSRSSPTSASGPTAASGCRRRDGRDGDARGRGRRRGAAAGGVVRRVAHLGGGDRDALVDGFHELLVGANASEADDVEAALHVQADLAALLPQVVAVRLSENRS